MKNRLDVGNNESFHRWQQSALGSSSEEEDAEAWDAEGAVATPEARIPAEKSNSSEEFFTAPEEPPADAVGSKTVNVTGLTTADAVGSKPVNVTGLTTADVDSAVILREVGGERRSHQRGVENVLVEWAEDDQMISLEAIWRIFERDPPEFD